VGDVIRTGDVLLTSQDGIVQINGPEGTTRVARADDTVDRAIEAVESGQGAPSAGASGGDGSLQEGFRVARISEGLSDLELRGALDAFNISVEGKVCLDVGSSTGGFTDCLLQAGAPKVYAIDVGWGLLDYKLRKDPRVHLLERTNFRFFEPNALPIQPDFVTVDVSFISLEKIFPKIKAVLHSGSEVLILVKPQFEAGKAEADRGGGVITDPAIHARVLAELEAFVGAQPGWNWRGQTESPLLGPAGNKEFLVLIEIEG
jgi:23S rRNA (cytidine1920-2'-O)/16S rRNA (cytidine1409-2'-O)-methyltransferase